ncbi:MarR family transcriptional regulator [Gordonia polyisoprenivorans]|uniref:MarR family winged helix-turn-helix transcriptional regulator n=1 Tax=Gordonia polyisoprenivorans TaxID=84595 RepID=UPI0019F01600|nr:MarR family transcriptional regulator [Gordonia polyisoprenivorans]UZF56394.1 MarR family transcriptional regulator [Gordonia polyisoprenivorans]
MTTTHQDTASIARAIRPALTRLYLMLRRHTPIPEYSSAQASGLATLLDHGPMRMGDFAARESIRMPTATSLVDGLIRNGLAFREPDPTDRRAVLVSLTDHGRAVLQRVREQRDDVLAHAIAELSDDDRAALAAAAPALRALHEVLEGTVPTRQRGDQ